MRDVYASLTEIAEAQKVYRSTRATSHIPRLTLLAPDVVERILNGRQGVSSVWRGSRIRSRLSRRDSGNSS